MAKAKLPAAVSLMYCPSPNAAAHPDLHTAWLAVQCAAMHGAMIDGIAMHFEAFADAGAFYDLVLDGFTTWDFISLPDAVRLVAKKCKQGKKRRTSKRPPATVWRWLARHTFEPHVGPPLSGELIELHKEPLMVSGVSWPNALAAAIRLLDARLGAVANHAGLELDEAKICERWPAIRADLCANIARVDWAWHGVLMERELTLVAARRERAAAVGLAPLSDSQEAADEAIRNGCRSLKEIDKETGIGIETLKNHVIPALKRKRGLRSRPYRYE